MNKKIRNSNMELLRITAMIMIIIYHITYHCVTDQISDMQYVGANIFSKPVFYKKLFLIEGVLPWGMLANSIFILISGYFLVERGKNVNLGNISQKLLLQLGTAAISLTLISSVFYKIHLAGENTSVKTLSIIDFNYMSWFVGYYFIVVVIACLFINNYINKLDQTSYRNLLLVWLGLFSFMWSGNVLDNIGDGLRTIICGLFMFELGGYIKKYNPFDKIRTVVLILLIIITYGFIYLSYVNNVNDSIHEYIANSVTEPFSQPFIRFDNYGIIPVILSVTIFELFRRVKIKNSKIINFLGSSTFMIYLVHDNEFWWNLWKERDWISLLTDTSFGYCKM
nr:acyltransferase [Butyrivibrio sp.]